MSFFTGPAQKSSKYGTGPPQQEKMTKYTGPTQDQDDENETRERERTWRLPVTIFSPDLCQVSPLHLLFHQKCALGHGPFPYHGEALKFKVRSLTILINDP